MTDRLQRANEARRRIREEAKRRTGFLDLSQLGLTELPAELFALRHLRRLHLGARLRSTNGTWWRLRPWDPGYGDDPSNNIAAQISQLAGLPNIEALSIGRTDCTDLRCLAPLGGLVWLECGDLSIDDLGPLTALTALQSLDCSETQVADLSPLAALSALQSLDCRRPRLPISAHSPPSPRCNR